MKPLLPPSCGGSNSKRMYLLHQLTYLLLILSSSTILRCAASSSSPSRIHHNRRLEQEQGLDIAAAIDLAKYSIKYESCDVQSQDPALDGGSGSGWHKGGNLDEGPPPIRPIMPRSSIEQRSVVTFRLCDTTTTTTSCDQYCDDSAHGEIVVSMEDYLETVLDYKFGMQENYCERCNECFENLEELSDVEGCDSIDTSVCYAECQMIENMESNGYWEAAEFIECQQIYEDESGDMYYAGAMCASSGSRIKIGIFLDEECSVYDASKMVEDYIKNEDGYGMKLSYHLLKQAFAEGECIASCLKEDEDDQETNQNRHLEEEEENFNGEEAAPIPDINEVCEELYYASTELMDYYNYNDQSDFDDDDDDGDGQWLITPGDGWTSFTPAPSPSESTCVYRSPAGTFFAGKFCEYEATSVCEESNDFGTPQFCTNGGICHFLYSGTCLCPSGFYGKYCELVQEEGMDHGVHEEEHEGGHIFANDDAMDGEDALYPDDDLWIDDDWIDDAMDDFWSNDDYPDDDIGYAYQSYPPTPTPICSAEDDALANCLTENDTFGDNIFVSFFGCLLCETTAQLQDSRGYYTCDGKKEHGFCGDYANCVKEQCNADCMDHAFDLMHCNNLNAEYEPCGLQCSIEDATNTTSNSTAPQSFEECYAEALVGGLLGIFDAPNTDTIVTYVGPGEACCVDFPAAPVCSPQSFDDCMLQSIYGLVKDNIFDLADYIFGDPAANSPFDFDLSVACCDDFPGAPMCALNGCFDKSTGMITCECSVVVDLLINVEASEFSQMMMGLEEGTAAAAAECCQKGVFNNEFQVCVDELFPDETDDGDMLSGGEGITFEDGNANTEISSTTDAIKDENSTSSTEAPPAAATEAPNIEAPPAATTEAPNTEAPPAATTEAPNTEAPPVATNEAPNTGAPPAATTEAPNTEAPPAAITTEAPNTEATPAATTTEDPNTDFSTFSASNKKDMVAVFISAVVVGGMQML